MHVEVIVPGPSDRKKNEQMESLLSVTPFASHDIVSLPYVVVARMPGSYRWHITSTRPGFDSLHEVHIRTALVLEGHLVSFVPKLMFPDQVHNIRIV